jgi:hypothetical protein
MMCVGFGSPTVVAQSPGTFNENVRIEFGKRDDDWRCV